MDCAYGGIVRALVVEDEVRTAALLRRGLAEEGYAVDMAADGPEGVWRATEFGYDGVVLAVMLPGFDGPEVCCRSAACGWIPRRGGRGAGRPSGACRRRSSRCWSCSCGTRTRCSPAPGSW